MLAAEFHAVQAATTQELPADALSTACVAAQFAGPGHFLVRHSPSPNLSPKGGEKYEVIQLPRTMLYAAGEVPRAMTSGAKIISSCPIRVGSRGEDR